MRDKSKTLISDISSPIDDVSNIDLIDLSGACAHPAKIAQTPSAPYVSMADELGSSKRTSDMCSLDTTDTEHDNKKVRNRDNDKDNKSGSDDEISSAQSNQGGLLSKLTHMFGLSDNEGTNQASQSSVEPPPVPVDLLDQSQLTESLPKLRFLPPASPIHGIPRKSKSPSRAGLVSKRELGEMLYKLRNDIKADMRQEIRMEMGKILNQ